MSEALSPDDLTHGDDRIAYREFSSRREGMIHAMDGGLWLHRQVWKGRRMAHLVSTDRARLVAWGASVGLSEARLQFKPLRDSVNSGESESAGSSETSWRGPDADSA